MRDMKMTQTFHPQPKLTYLPIIVSQVALSFTSKYLIPEFDNSHDFKTQLLDILWRPSTLKFIVVYKVRREYLQMAVCSTLLLLRLHRKSPLTCLSKIHLFRIILIFQLLIRYENCKM